MLYAIIGILVIILDQGVKYWITTHLMVDVVTEPLIPGILSLVRLHNDGAAFSFLAGGGARIYFIILTAVFTVAVIIALVTNFISGRFGRWCLVLVTAGGLSNCLDRVLYGYVVDMFKIDLFNFAVFNVADIFITLFSLLFILYIIFGGEEKAAKDYDEFDEDDDEEADRPSLSAALKKDRAGKKTERVEKAVKATHERGASIHAAKYSTDEEEAASPRFQPKRSTQAKAAPAEPARAARKPLDGFGKKGEQASGRAAKGKKTLYEEDYEQYKAAHPELDSAPRKSAKSSSPAFDPTDPFAEWERANARVESRQNSSFTAKAMGVPQAAAEKPAAPKRKAPILTEPAADFEQPPERRAPQAPAPAPVKPAEAPKKASTDMDFTLDDILNEFK